jgi:hypothetical protein
MAVRFECPIYTYDFILEAAGVVLEEQEANSARLTEEQANFDSDALEQHSMDTLQRKLQEVLDAEDYESAAKIRDEMKRRESKS